MPDIILMECKANGWAWIVPALCTSLCVSLWTTKLNEYMVVQKLFAHPTLHFLQKPAQLMLYFHDAPFQCQLGSFSIRVQCQVPFQTWSTATLKWHWVYILCTMSVAIFWQQKSQSLVKHSPMSDILRSGCGYSRAREFILSTLIWNIFDFILHVLQAETCLWKVGVNVHINLWVSFKG